jgi:hypothetical protein
VAAVAHSLEPLLELCEAQGRGDEPYPCDYPKMPGEPKRLQPNRDRNRKRRPPIPEPRQRPRRRSRFEVEKQALWRTRTADPLLTMEVLYRLS